MRSPLTTLTTSQKRDLSEWLAINPPAAERWIRDRVPREQWDELRRELCALKPSSLRWTIDPAGYRERLLIETDDGARPLVDAAEPWQLADYEALDPAWRTMALGESVPGARLRAYIERPKGHSKTTDIAVQSVWALAAAPRIVWGLAAANDRDQAGLLRKAILRLKQDNPWLPLAVHNWQVSNPTTGSTLSIIAHDIAGSHGETPDFVICDEITHWRGEGLYEALRAGSVKRRNCVFVVITNAGFGRGTSWQWKVRETARTSPAWYFSTLDGPRARWMTADRLAEMRAELSEQTFARLYLNQWQAESSGAIAESDLVAATTLPGPHGSGRPGYRYIGAVDLGLRHDHAAAVFLGIPFDGRPWEVARVLAWKPRDFGGEIDLSVVEADIAAAAKSLGAERIVGDEHQFALMAQRLSRTVCRCETVPFGSAQVRKTLAPRLLQAFRLQRVRLYYHADLERDLRRMSFIEDPVSRTWRVEAPATEADGHADRGIALALAVMAAYDDAVGAIRGDADTSLCDVAPGW